MEINKDELISEIRAFFESITTNYKSFVDTLVGKPEYEAEKRYLDGYINAGWHLEKFINDKFDSVQYRSVEDDEQRAI